MFVRICLYNIFHYDIPNPSLEIFRILGDETTESVQIAWNVSEVLGCVSIGE